MNNKADAQWLANALDLAATTCQTIDECGACRGCPLYSACIDANNLTDIAFEITAEKWKDFLDYAEDALNCTDEDYDSEENQRALYADFQRKYELEERMIDEEYGL